MQFAKLVILNYNWFRISNFGKILGVESGAKKREVRAAYLAKVNLTHPDKGGDPEKFKKVQAAYDLLRKNRFQA